MKKISSLIFLVLISYNLNAQVDTSYFKGLFKEARRQFNHNLDTAIIKVNFAQGYAKSVNYKLGILQCEYFKALYFSRKGDFLKAIEISENAQKECVKKELINLKTNFLRFIGLRNKDLKRYILAEKYFKKALENAVSQIDSNSIGNI